MEVCDIIQEAVGEGNGTPLQYTSRGRRSLVGCHLWGRMGSWRVRNDWANSLSLFTFMHWRRKWQSTPVFLPGQSQAWEPGGLPSMGLCRVGHDWCDLAAAQEAVIKTIIKKKKCKKAKWLSKEALQIAVKRREAKGKGEKERYTHSKQ